jgi:hypothetical protein
MPCACQRPDGCHACPAVVDAADSPYYWKYASRLAERGYVVYAPQSPYVGEEAFRRLQRKANPLRWSLCAFMVRQHQQALAWLTRLPVVDPHWIASYGLSSGGERALRLPAILEDYCLSVGSGDFNEFVVKTVGLDLANGSVFNRAYEIYGSDLANTFDRAELAGLIAARPFMVERGRRDGVGLDEWVAFEHARVRRRYADPGVPERTAVRFLEGGHVADGTEAFAFLDRHLSWSPRTAAEPRAGDGARAGRHDRFHLSSTCCIWLCASPSTCRTATFPDAASLAMFCVTSSSSVPPGAAMRMRR